MLWLPLWFALPMALFAILFAAFPSFRIGH